MGCHPKSWGWIIPGERKRSNYLRGEGLAAGLAYIYVGIDRAAVLVDFEVQVGASGSAAAAHESDHLSFFDNIARANKKQLAVCIARENIVAMIDLDEPAITLSVTSESHYAIGCRHNRCAGLAGEIYPLMHTAGARDRIDSHTEIRRYVAAQYGLGTE